MHTSASAFRVLVMIRVFFVCGRKNSFFIRTILKKIGSIKVCESGPDDDSTTVGTQYYSRLPLNSIRIILQFIHEQLQVFFFFVWCVCVTVLLSSQNVEYIVHFHWMFYYQLIHLYEGVCFCGTELQAHIHRHKNQHPISLNAILRLWTITVLVYIFDHFGGYFFVYLFCFGLIFVSFLIT